MTNLEKLRTAEPEEIVKFLCKGRHCNQEDCVAYWKCNIGHNGFIDWLKDEVVEDEWTY